ncbi:hypothetical protein PGTUg99_017731 [Puccinia graminis f. sp. tritici]|uniref:Uncharacterized protein n=1 Tax=Puccinia graminis f. sp. tritici TaxID=56615 RepID=A0A5B0NEA6_PUCGR|nr:hypothetical protein PGTUg99_017731 [Puccinia graminis f. sp. tritici]
MPWAIIIASQQADTSSACPEAILKVCQFYRLLGSYHNQMEIPKDMLQSFIYYRILQSSPENLGLLKLVRKLSQQPGLSPHCQSSVLGSQCISLMAPEAF